MTNTGIIRRVDELGRIVIPIEIRNQFDIIEKDPMEIYVENDTIIIKKHKQKCSFCENTTNLLTFSEKLICQDCIDKIKKI